MLAFKIIILLCGGALAGFLLAAFILYFGFAVYDVIRGDTDDK